ncbi:MAG: MmgE/PrpD family protein [Gammaproteobacteria bacterium]|nr:MAG: MmgE/PrpD family protein [Gammaproteobacteria bacterium]
MGQLTESITEFLAARWEQPLPAAAVATVVRGFTDCVAVMLAGHAEPLPTALRQHARRRAAAEPDAPLMLTAERASVADAARIGTAAAHALDYDDYAFSNHVSALLVPAILADAARLGAGGAAALEAYLAGFETWGEVFKREPDHLHSQGWHPTGVFGPLGVAAALCRLRGFDRERCRNALGLAVAAGCGLMDNFGSQAKPWQGARAAGAGVVAVELAELGVDAGPDALDGSGGLLAALSPRGRVDRQRPATALGREWLAARNSLNIKPYPMVGASQRAIDAALQLHRDHQPDPTEIREIVVRVSEKHAAVMRLHRPQTAAEARFSAEFAVAAALIAGRVSLAELRDDFVRRDDVQALIAKVRIETTADDDPAYPVGARFDSVQLSLQDGSRLESRPVHRFRGHGENPLTTEELRAKFLDCSAPAIGRSAADRLFLDLQRLPDLGSVADLPALEFTRG